MYNIIYVSMYVCIQALLWHSLSNSQGTCELHKVTSAGEPESLKVHSKILSVL